MTRSVVVETRNRWRWLKSARAFCSFVAALAGIFVAEARAVGTSAPAILQIYEARWRTIEDRMADVFMAGYGQMWLPPPARAGGGFSVGYDVFDRFDLGAPRNETLYGTETLLKSNIAAAHRAGMSVYTDFIPNHNGFGTRMDANFVTVGGYPGFALTLPNDINGDFHDLNASGDLEGRLAGLLDIAQEKNYSFIRHPIAAGPNNIPAGTTFNRPNPNNARLYPNRDDPGMMLNDPALGGAFTRYQFDAANPLQGDPVLENATGLLMRNAQWMVEVVGVDGFRIDAAKHFPTWVMNYLDQAVFRANPRLQHDGSFKPVFMFSEVYDGSKSFQQQFIRKTLPDPHGIDPANITVGGNRDVLDFPLFFALRDNLTGNGAVNNWHRIRAASMDTNDKGASDSVWHSDGSQGVAFVQSHDDHAPHLANVAYAYTLLRPGNADVYMNAKEFGTGRDFPKDGRGDALGGLYGESITTLLNIRNSHGRGDFHERWVDDAFNPNGFSNIYIYERADSIVVGLSSRLDTGFDQRTPVQTAFAPGTVLVELTGNAADAVVDPGGNIPEAIRVNGSGQVTMRVPRNASHGRGYVAYGVATPRGTLTLDNVSQVLEGGTPTASTNGTTRLADIDVITADTFGLRLATMPVTLPAPMGETNPVRDFHADGDNALFKIDGGMNFNNLPGVDFADPGSTHYGFEQFTDTHSTGYISDGAGGNTGAGVGQYEQEIDATQLAEGRHFITVRAFRHRPNSGTPVFNDFRRVIYVDRLPPEAAIVSFQPFASNPSNPNNRDLIVRSLDQTANNVHVLLDVPAALTEQQILQMVSGSNQAGYYDRDMLIRGVTSVTRGNHVATVVTYEPTGNYNIQRFPGLFTQTNLGLGFGDMNASGVLTVSDIRGTGNNSVEDVLYSQNTKFRAAFDLNGDGLGDNRDLIALDDALVGAGAGQAVLDSYTDLLLKRADVNASGTTDGADVAAIYGSFGLPSWLMDLNVDGLVNIADVQSIVTQLVRTVPGDFNLDGSVDAADYVVWRNSIGGPDATYTQGDADFDGDVDGADYATWRSEFGFVRQPLSAGAGGGALAPVPEPAMLWLLAFAVGLCGKLRRNRTASPGVPLRRRRYPAEWFSAYAMLGALALASVAGCAETTASPNGAAETNAVAESAAPEVADSESKAATAEVVAADESPDALSSPTVPEWAADAIFYQLFPERFANGDRGNDPTRESLEFAEGVPESWSISPWAGDWYARAEWEKQLGPSFYENGVFHRRYGGDLQGVMDKLEYLETLGINAIYFNPVFYARSLHKYDGNSFHHVDPYFGPDPMGDLALMAEETSDPASWHWTKADRLFLALIERAHERGIRIVIDGVFNHTGRDFFAFADVRERGAKSPYRDWYIVQHFDDPATPQNEFRYKGWWGVDSLPEFANDDTDQDLHPGPKQYVMDSTKRWMDPNGDGDPADGIDGWRLDVANEVPAGFWRDWHAAARSINPQCYTVAEVWNDARHFLEDARFSAIMNYHGFAFPAKGFLIDRVLPASAAAKEFDARRGGYPRAVQYALQNLVDSHDTDRVASMIVNAGRRPYEQSERFDFDVGVSPRYVAEYDVRKPNDGERRVQRLVALLQVTYVGAPMIYYGTEAGMWGADDPCDRMPMVWPGVNYEPQAAHPLGKERQADAVTFDESLFNYYRAAIALRGQSSPLRRGILEFLAADDKAQFLAFRRADAEGSLLVGINRGNGQHRWEITLAEGETVEQLFTASGNVGQFSVESQASGAIVSVPVCDGVVLRVVPKE